MLLIFVVLRATLLLQQYQYLQKTPMQSHLRTAFFSLSASAHPAACLQSILPVAKEFKDPLPLIQIL